MLNSWKDNVGMCFTTYQLFFAILQGSVAIAGAAVRWLRDNLGLIKSAIDIGK